MPSASLRDSVDTIRLKRHNSCGSLASVDLQSATIIEPSPISDLCDMDINALNQEVKNLILECQSCMHDLLADPDNSSKKQSLLQTKVKLQRIKEWSSKLNTEEGRRLLEEQKTYVEKRKYEIDQVLKIIKAQSAVDICFLLDCTSSMKKYIKAVKDNINQLTNTIMSLFETKPSLAFIGYRDVHNTTNSLVQLNFTTDVNIFREFLNGVDLKGGKDYCEDVIGKKKYTF